MIKFLDLKQINSVYSKEIIKAAKSTIISGRYITGDRCLAFEKEFAKYCGAKYCIGVANGLEALSLIFKAYIELGLSLIHI